MLPPGVVQVLPCEFVPLVRDDIVGLFGLTGGNFVNRAFVLNILFLIFSACGGANDTTTESSEISTTTSSTTTLAESSSGEIYNEAELVVPPILLKPLIGATGILTSNSEETGK